MRTEVEVKANISAIRGALGAIKKQISLLENEYQPNAVENTGDINEDWEDMIENLKQAWDNMNTMLHMEIDILMQYLDED